ncbi:tyrosine-type recombinase/integrase [Lactiplantibacillus nangangensis]|uniref:Tyrosine-type recombinase/integrase n=1 Tax=Lactiplantibacillus nangangensis TaxID=2559917 RepID=A0ABW1SMW1_9LACO|nr:site-specific integrase [Lactiplantibacillus nangangensis]
MQGHLRKRGDSWYYSFEGAKIKGKRKRFETYGGKTRVQAESALRKALDEYENGGAPIKLSNISVSDYFDYWHKNFVVKTLKYNTQTNYRNVIDKYIKPALGMYKMKAVSAVSIQQAVNNLPTNLAKHTIDIIISVIRKGFKMAVFPYQVLNQNPADYIIPPINKDDLERTVQERRTELKIISLSQFKEILSMVPEASPFYLPLQIGFNTGLRRGEISGLTWDNINFEEQTLTVNKQMIMKPKSEFAITSPKTKASYRTIAIGKTLVEILKHARKEQLANHLRYGKFYYESNFVCTKANGKPVTPSVIHYYAGKVSKDVDFPFNFHSLRHTHATMLLEHNANYKEIQQRLGHSRIATTMDTYSHVTQKMKRDTVDIFEQMLDNSH